MIDLLDETVEFDLDPIKKESEYTEGLDDLLNKDLSPYFGDRTAREVKVSAYKARKASEKMSSDKLVSKDGYQPSIVARARNSILQFPVYITQGLRVDEAHVISKLFERVYTTLVQTVMAQNPVLSAEEANNLVFLKKYHTNLVTESKEIINKYYEAIDDLDRMMQDSLFYKEDLSPRCTVEFHLGVPEPELIKENARLLNEPLSGFFYLQEKIERQTTINNTQTTSNKGSSSSITTKEVPEKSLDEKDMEGLAKKYKYDDVYDLKEDIVAEDITCTIGGRPVRYRYNGAGYEFYLPRTTDKSTTVHSGGKDSTSNSVTSSQTKTLIDDVKVPVILKEAEIKKINGMLPYTMEVQFHIKDDRGNIAKLVRYILGIKSVLHLISIKDLSEDLREIINGDMKSLRKVRYKTGELSFSDYYLDKSNAKKAALNSVKGNRKWLNTLRRLGDYQKLQGTVFSRQSVVGSALRATGGNVEKLLRGDVDFPIPNGTMVLSQPEVVKLMNDTGIDLSVVANAKRLAKAIFLIAVVIVDSTAGTMRILFTDSDSKWDVQSLSSIQSEVNKVDNKKLASEISHMINR